MGRQYGHFCNVNNEAYCATVHRKSAEWLHVRFDEGHDAFELVHGPQTTLDTRLEPLGSFTAVRVLCVRAIRPRSCRCCCSS